MVHTQPIRKSVHCRCLYLFIVSTVNVLKSGAVELVDAPLVSWKHLEFIDIHGIVSLGHFGVDGSGEVLCVCFLYPLSDDSLGVD